MHNVSVSQFLQASIFQLLCVQEQTYNGIRHLNLEHEHQLQAATGSGKSNLSGMAYLA